MRKKVRRVPANWKHPKDEKGDYVPCDEHFTYSREEIEEGLRDGWLVNDPPNYGCHVMPQWPEIERTHYQMYATVNEGVPISPVMETPEDLARWLTDNYVPDDTLHEAKKTYDQWLAMVKQGGSFPPVTVIESILKAKLREAGLPLIPGEIVGRLYSFGCEHGSHFHILSGMVQAIEVLDEGGLDLYVTNPHFWGERLISIKHSNGKWMAYVDIKPREQSNKSLERMSEKEHERVIAEDIAARFFEGEFSLL